MSTKQECDGMTKDKLWSLCGRLGIPKPGSGKKNDVKVETIKESCCYPDTLAFGNLFTKANNHKMVKRFNLSTGSGTELDDNSFVVVDPKQEKKIFVKCRNTIWPTKKSKKLILGTFYGQNCSVIECKKDACNPKKDQDIVTIKAFKSGRSLGINKSNISKFTKDNFNSL